MSIVLKCKMCGGDISVNADMTVGTCQYCGSTMTLPRVDTDKKARLFNHANQYRLNCEFDKAFEAYHLISEEDEQEPEAYWGMLLSEYGVEYVEDPKTKKRIPTCHRTIVKPVKSNTCYELAYKYADTESKLLYQDEAEILDEIQRKIVAISSKEEPYDVFICYKETDDDTGERTQDSVSAQEIYDELTKNGLKVFFSRITLGDKLGTSFEPYIYSALKTAKVMLVVCSTTSNANSVWVKNEWSRYIQFMSEDTQKTLIPVFKNMAVNELPFELSRFQGQDLNKVGAIQDLVISVKKIISVEKRIASDEALNTLIEKQLEKEKKQKELELKRRLIIQKLPGILKKIAVIVIIVAIVFGLVAVAKPIIGSVKEKNALDDSFALAVQYAEQEKFTQAYNAIIDEEDVKNRNETLYNYITAGYTYEKKDYISAKEQFIRLNEYMNSEYMVHLCEYKLLANTNGQDIDQALEQLEKLEALGVEDFDDMRGNLIIKKLEYIFKTDDYQEFISLCSEYEEQYPQLVERIRALKQEKEEERVLETEKNKIVGTWLSTDSSLRLTFSADASGTITVSYYTQNGKKYTYLGTVDYDENNDCSLFYWRNWELHAIVTGGQLEIRQGEKTAGSGRGGEAPFLVGNYDKVED